MKTSKIVVLTKVQNDSEFSEFWHGDLFYKSNNPKHGILDKMNLCKLLKYKYIKSLDKFVGDFCLMPNLVK